MSIVSWSESMSISGCLSVERLPRCPLCAPAILQPLKRGYTRTHTLLPNWIWIKISKWYDTTSVNVNTIFLHDWWSICARHTTCSPHIMMRCDVMHHSFVCCHNRSRLWKCCVYVPLIFTYASSMAVFAGLCARHRIYVPIATRHTNYNADTVFLNFYLSSMLSQFCEALARMICCSWLGISDYLFF